MSDKKLSGKEREHSGDVQSADIELSNKIERAFRTQSPNFIDVYPLAPNRRDKLERLSHLDIKPNEKVDAVQAVKLTNDIVSECQNNCDQTWGGVLRPREQCYQVLIIDNHRGGTAQPVATHTLALLPRVSRPAPPKRDDDEEDNPLTGTSMIERIFNKDQERKQEATETILEAAGDIMLLQKAQNEKLFGVVQELINENRTTMKEMGGLLREQGQRLVEMQAVAIEGKVADEDIADRRSKRQREHILTDFAADTLKDMRELFGPLVGEFFSDMVGKDKPQITDGKEKKQLDAGKGDGKPAEEGSKDAGPSEERTMVGAVLDEVERLGLDELLFGRVDEAGKLEQAGVFSIEQMKILIEVKDGSAPAAALDALIPKSGSPHAITEEQIRTARSRVPLPLLMKMMQVVSLRNRRRAAAPTNGESHAQ